MRAKAYLLCVLKTKVKIPSLKLGLVLWKILEWDTGKKIACALNLPQ